MDSLWFYLSIDAYDVKSSAGEESVTPHFPADDQYYSFKTTGERLMEPSDTNIKGQWAVILRLSHSGGKSDLYDSVDF